MTSPDSQRIVRGGVAPPAEGTARQKTYRVTGIHRVFGVEPGETFTRKLDVAHERRLLTAGAITVVTSSARARRARAKPKPKRPPAPPQTGDTTTDQKE